jgi:hypothetical protein
VLSKKNANHSAGWKALAANHALRCVTTQQQQGDRIEAGNLPKTELLS